MNVGNGTREKVQAQMVEIILVALKELQESLGKNWAMKVSPETRLYGHGSDIDSLGLVQLLIDVEERVSDRYDLSVVLTDEKAMSQEKSPFRTVDSLAAYLTALVEAHRAF